MTLCVIKYKARKLPACLKGSKMKKISVYAQTDGANNSSERGDQSHSLESFCVLFYFEYFFSKSAKNSDNVWPNPLAILAKFTTLIFRFLFSYLLNVAGSISFSKQNSLRDMPAPRRLCFIYKEIFS